MHRDGWDGPKASSAIPYAWFVWNRAHVGTTEMLRLSWNKLEDVTDKRNVRFEPERRVSTRLCALCGAAFQPKRTDALTCSNRCRQSLFRRRMSSQGPG